MDDLRRRVEEGQRGLETLMGSIPGFKGYKQKEMRREADKLLRVHLARKLSERRERLGRIQADLAEAGKLEFLTSLEHAMMRLQRFIDRLLTASYGYSGFFDAVKVKEEELDRLYDFDNVLMAQLEAIDAALDRLDQAVRAEAEIPAASDELKRVLGKSNDLLDKREDVILGAAEIAG